MKNIADYDFFAIFGEWCKKAPLSNKIGLLKRPFTIFVWFEATFRKFGSYRIKLFSKRGGGNFYKSTITERIICQHFPYIYTCI